MQAASIVLAGTIINCSVNEVEGYRWFTYKVKIDQLFKGQVRSNTIDIWTHSAGTACGIKFKTKKVLIYAVDAAFYHLKTYAKGRSFYTNVCTRSGAYSPAEVKKILQSLGRL